MRQTAGQLLQTSKDYCVDDQATTTNNLSSTESFLKNEIVNTISELYTLFKTHKTQELPKTMSTVADQIYYHIPPGLNSIQTVTMTVGSVDYPLIPVTSQFEWDKLQMVDYASSTIPKYFFVRRRDFGIYPTPQDVYTVTLTGNYQPKRLSVWTDVTGGTVAISANGTTVTGTSTAFTSAMVGRWFCLTNEGIPSDDWYRISGYTSPTSITLETNYAGDTVSGSGYIIGESPDLPEEIHQFIPIRTAAVYNLTRRRDGDTARELFNTFYTGDPHNPNRKGNSIKGGVLAIAESYKLMGRSNSQIVYRKKVNYDRFNEMWSTTLTDSS